MRGLKRWTYRILVGLSSLLLVVTIAAWVRGQFSADFLSYHYGHGQHAIYFRKHSIAYYGWGGRGEENHDAGERGEWKYTGWPFSTGRTPGETDDVDLMLPPHSAQGINYAGFGFLIWGPRFGGGSPRLIVKVPYWALLLISAPLPTSEVVRQIRKKRRGIRGLCLVCGYDLRRNVEGRCPECGSGQK